MDKTLIEAKVDLEDTNLARVIAGDQDRFLRFIESALSIVIFPKGHLLTLRGTKDSVELAKNLFKQLTALTKKGYRLQARDIDLALRMLKENPNQDLISIFFDSIGSFAKSLMISPKTKNQKHLIELIKNHDIVFVWGPAGTGKTYLSMAMAVSSFLKREVDRIILTRPAVEAGEKLGFLPGDLAEKINPYIRPLFDALHDMMDLEKAQSLIAKGIIELAPLAFMRGRTLNKSFVILDEAQNTTPEQMKMFLTRIGFESKVIITGDVTQIDLPQGKKSGLSDALRKLADIKDIGFIQLGTQDVVRHPIIQKIVDAYDTQPS